MSKEELSLRIKVESATKAGFAKTISGLKSFANKAKSIIKRGFRAMKPTIPKPNSSLALRAIRVFSRKATNIINKAFSRMGRVIGRFSAGMARSIRRGVRNALVALGACALFRFLSVCFRCF